MSKWGLYNNSRVWGRDEDPVNIFENKTGGDTADKTEQGAPSKTTTGSGGGGGGGGKKKEATIYGGWQWGQMDQQAEIAKEEDARYKQWMVPYLEAGQRNLRSFDDFMAGRVDVAQTPGYQFRYNQGMDAMNKQLSAQHRTLGGAALKSAMNYGQGMAANEYANEFSRRMAAAYQAPPVNYGGHPNLPTLKDLQKKYGDMFGMDGDKTKGNGSLNTWNGQAIPTPKDVRCKDGSMSSQHNYTCIRNGGIEGQ